MVSIDNIAFAAFLIHGGQKLVGVDRQKRRVFWKFDLEKKEIDKFYAEWISSRENEFFSKYLSLKSDMKNIKRGTS